MDAWLSTEVISSVSSTSISMVKKTTTAHWTRGSDGCMQDLRVVERALMARSESAQNRLLRHVASPDSRHNVALPMPLQADRRKGTAITANDNTQHRPPSLLGSTNSSHDASTTASAISPSAHPRAPPHSPEAETVKSNEAGSAL